MWVVRIALPAAIFVAGVVLIVIGGDAPLGAGIVLIGVSGLVVLGNLLMQLAGQSERDRAEEERRRRHRRGEGGRPLPHPAQGLLDSQFVPRRGAPRRFA